MGAFNDKVFEMVARIPQGFVTTYGDIARAIGEPRKARFVGYAMHAAPGPDKLPCHRVVFKEETQRDSPSVSTFIFSIDRLTHLR